MSAKCQKRTPGMLTGQYESAATYAASNKWRAEKVAPGHCATSSTRRFFARPSSVSFDATGWVSPGPSADSRSPASFCDNSDSRIVDLQGVASSRPWPCRCAVEIRDHKVTKPMGSGCSPPDLPLWVISRYLGDDDMGALWQLPWKDCRE